MPRKSAAGFTLIELLVVIAIIAIIAAMAVPGLLRARMSGNEASAIGSLHSIRNGQMNFSANCGYGAFAGSLAELYQPPIPGGESFISAALKNDPSQKTGYIIAMTPGAAVVGLPPACNAATQVATYAVTATPVTVNATGTRYFFMNGSTIWQDLAAIVPVQTGSPATGRPIR